MFIFLKDQVSPIEAFNEICFSEV